MAIGYTGETKAFGVDMAGPIVRALKGGAYSTPLSDDLGARKRTSASRSRTGCSRSERRSASSPHRPGYNATCTVASPVAPNGSSSGQALRSDVAAFQIGDGEFISVPGEVFPFTYLRGAPRAPGHAEPRARRCRHGSSPTCTRRFASSTDSAEDMLGYIFPAGNAVGIPSATTSTPPTRTASAAGTPTIPRPPRPHAADIIGAALIRVLDAPRRSPELIRAGRYVLPGGALLARSPRRARDQVHARRRPSTSPDRAVGVELAGGRVVHPRLWMSLSGLPQRAPDRDTRGYFDARGRRVWLNVF